MLHHSWSLHLNCVVNLHLRHLQSNWKNICLLYIYLAPPYHKSLSVPSFHDCVLIWGTVCVKFLSQKN